MADTAVWDFWQECQRTCKGGKVYVPGAHIFDHCPSGKTMTDSRKSNHYRWSGCVCGSIVLACGSHTATLAFIMHCVSTWKSLLWAILARVTGRSHWGHPESLSAIPGGFIQDQNISEIQGLNFDVKDQHVGSLHSLLPSETPDILQEQPLGHYSAVYTPDWLQQQPIKENANLCRA